MSDWNESLLQAVATAFEVSPEALHFEIEHDRLVREQYQLDHEHWRAIAMRRTIAMSYAFDRLFQAYPLALPATT